MGTIILSIGRNESLLSDCRVQPILCKDSANERNESLLSDCRVQPILCKVTTIYIKPLCYKEKILARQDSSDEDFLIFFIGQFPFEGKPLCRFY